MLERATRRGPWLLTTVATSWTADIEIEWIDCWTSDVNDRSIENDDKYNVTDVEWVDLMLVDHTNI